MLVTAVVGGAEAAARAAGTAPTDSVATAASAVAALRTLGPWRIFMSFITTFRLFSGFSEDLVDITGAQ
jgi:hypothetical protein